MQIGKNGRGRAESEKKENQDGAAATGRCGF